MRTLGDLVTAKTDDVAGRIADLTTALEAVRTANAAQKAPTVTVNVPEAKAPEVSVHVPQALAPVVHVQVPEQLAPIVNIEAAKQLAPLVKVEPQITVLPPVARAYEVRITERDENGFIAAFRIEPV